MKTVAIILTGMMMSVLASGQTNPQFNPALEREPISINRYLSEHVRASGFDTETLLPGTQAISFVVTSRGEVKDLFIQNSLSEELDEIMLQALKETSGSWLPGLLNGETMDMEYKASVSFFPESYDPEQKARVYLSKWNVQKYKNPDKALKYINKAYNIYPFNESIQEAKTQFEAKLGMVDEA